MAIAIVGLIVSFQTVVSAILRGPSNVAVVAGNNMTMICEPTTGTIIDWYHSPIRSKDITPALHRINYGSRIQKNFSEFSVEGKIPGEMLHLKITQLQHAGFYQCTATGRKATAQLVVLASEPQCNVSSHVIAEEANRVDLVCSVSYSGTFAPVMEWSLTTVGNKTARAIPIYDYINIIDSIQNKLTSNLSLIIDASTRGFRYSCKTYFNNISSSEGYTTASNTPKYERIWTSSVIEMYYGPKNVTISLKKEVFHPGDVLKCLAEATLSTEFEWREVETGNVFKGPNMVINASMLRDKPYSFSCTAINKLTGAYAKSSLFSFAVRGKHSEDAFIVTTDDTRAENSADERQSDLILIIFVVATFVVMSIAIAVCVSFFRRKRKRNRVLQKERDSSVTVTHPMSTAENTSTITVVVANSLPEHNVQPISVRAELSGSYEEIETESEGTPSSCYNVRNVSGDQFANDEDVKSNERNSNSSAGSKEMVKSAGYEDLLERDPVKPSVYLRMVQSNKEQEKQTSNSPTSSEGTTQSTTIYVNIIEMEAAI